LEGAASRAVRALQLDRKREAEPMTLEQHLAANTGPGPPHPPFAQNVAELFRPVSRAVRA
jgi:hypothetical protein